MRGWYHWKNFHIIKFLLEHTLVFLEIHGTSKCQLHPGKFIFYWKISELDCHFLLFNVKYACEKSLSQSIILKIKLDNTTDIQKIGKYRVPHLLMSTTWVIKNLDIFIIIAARNLNLLATRIHQLFPFHHRSPAIG